MNYAIVCASKTGNTKLLADAIQSSLPEEKVIYAGIPQAEALQADRIFVGFWTDKGTCCEEIKDFLKHIKNKEIFLFGTCGFGGSEAYFQKVLTAVKKNIDSSNTIVGTYMCQGKMPQSVKDRYLKMKKSPVPVPNVDQLIANFDTALTHPDTLDLEKLKNIVKML